jgi:hypothetical protein
VHGALASPRAAAALAPRGASPEASSELGSGGRGYASAPGPGRLDLCVKKMRSATYEPIALQRVLDELAAVVRRDESGGGRTAAAAGDVGAVEATVAAMRANIRDAATQASGARLLHALVNSSEANRERARCVAATSALSEAAAVHRAQTGLCGVVHAVLLLLD